MSKWIPLCLFVLLSSSASAATIEVPPGGNLQAAINAAQPGDTILLAPGATYEGNFVLPVHGGTSYITLRTGVADDLLPAAGVRMTPAYAPYLAKIKSSNVMTGLRTAPGAAFWRLQLLEFLPNVKSMNDIIALGDGSSAQNTLEKVPHHLILDRLYVHGDPLTGQKRGIALNSGETSIVNSHVSDIKGAGQDTQAIAGWNGTGPYYIANNYLEAAGNGVLIGGDDPKIPNVTASDILFRGNTVSRPLSWRDPIVATPANVRTAIGAGSLAAGTYAYRVVARRNLWTSTATSAPTAEVTVTVGASSQVGLTWDPVPDATDYVVYGRTPGAINRYWIVQGTTFGDTGSTGTAGSPASKGTVWTVKNLFELKNARRVQVDYNLMENNWAQAQNGFAILFTPRNQYGSCTWCVVESVTFEHNVVRHIGGGVNMTGYDDEQISQQTNAIVIRNNEFSDYSRGWGGTGYFLSIGNAPRDVTVDHNTLISGSGAGLIVASGAPTTGFVFTNNIGRHDNYGILGSGKGYGNPAINYYFPGGVITRNVIAGGVASEYPAGNLFTALTAFGPHFTNYAGADFTLVPGTDWANAGTDSRDLGADMVALHATPGGALTEPPSIVTASLPQTTAGDAYVATLEGQGGRAPYRWRVFAGTLPNGLQLEELTGELHGAATGEGDSAFTIELEDANGATSRRPFSLHVESAVQPVELLTEAFEAATATLPYSTVLAATGGLGTYSWTVSAGELPQGLTLSNAGVLSGVAAQQGSYAFTVTVADAAGASRSAARGFLLIVEPKPNMTPIVSLAASTGAVVQLAAPVTLSATASDADGTIARVDLLVDGTPVASAVAAPFAFTWTAVPGVHRFSVQAFDDAGAMAVSEDVLLSTKMEVVIHAADVTAMAGNYRLVSDPTAASVKALSIPDRYAPKAPGALAAPTHYAEFQFYAEAGRPYHLWIRGLAQRNDYDNDSAYLQFSNISSARIGTTGKLTYQLEDAPLAGLSGWGWQDNGLGTAPGMLGAHITFEQGGLQTLRIQSREDGLEIDQIVISPDQFLLAAPGGLKNDATIVAR